jgi:hypothetical protein
MTLKPWSAIACAALILGLFAHADSTRADVGSLPTIDILQKNQMNQLAGTANWTLGDINTLSTTKASPEHSLPALLTLSWLGSIVHGEASTDLYTSSMVLFGNGTSQTRSDISWIWEVARAKPSLYLVLAMTSVKMFGPPYITVLAINTYRFTIQEVLHRGKLSDATLQCGMVFSTDGQHYSVRGTKYRAGGATDLTHALIRGVNTCT